MLTVVVNLHTGAERPYSLPPAEALVAAYEQVRGNWNTWTYSESSCPVEEGKYTLSAGDWTVLKAGAERA